MYRSHWHLRTSPFRASGGVRYFHRAAAHEEALARLRYLVDDHRRLGLLLGESGVGKTLVLSVLAGALRRRGRQVAHVSLRGSSCRELLWQLAAELQLAPRHGDDVYALWRSVSDHLAENRYQRLHTVLLLDDVDQAPAETRALAARLAQSDSAADAPLTIVVSADYDCAEHVGAALLDLVELRVDLARWDANETAEFLAASLAAADAQQQIFSDEAVQQLHRLSGGIPRRVAQLADLALLAGAGGGLKQVDAETVQSACDELAVSGTVAPPPRAVSAGL